MKKLLISVVIALLFTLIPQYALAKPHQSVTAGGVLFEGKGKDAQKITFGFNIFKIDKEEYKGHIQVNFHNVLDDSLDKTKFNSTKINEIWFSENDLDGVPYHFIGVNASGQFTGEDGWTLVIRMSDFGEPGKASLDTGKYSDAMRISVFDPYNQNVWDSSANATVGFPREQAWRTLLNGGNIKAHY